ncbi:MAG: hypothetical protein HZC50_04085 [Nitrospirae bacterium]|nr:hypothetical protein [Nitrospirota bacterium]
MTDEQAMVEAFHRKFEIVAQTAPMDVSEETKHLRVRLIQEEFDELKEAMASRSGYRCMMPPVCPRVHERSTLPKLRNPLRPSRL